MTNIKKNSNIKKNNIHPWHEFNVKQITKQNITITSKDTRIELPLDIINFSVKEGDNIFLCIINEDCKNQEQTELAKKILNVILGNEN